MTNFEHILFPVDFSKRCYDFRPLVQSLAKRFQSKVTLMHVIETPVGWYGGQDVVYPVLFDFEEMKSSAFKELDKFYASSVEQSSIRTAVAKVVEHGTPALYITEYARDNGVDLIVMPTHGYGRFRRFILGSVTAKILHDARCAVLTGSHTEEPELKKHLDCLEIMCAVDLTPASVPLIRDALELAHKFKAGLRLVHGAGFGDVEYLDDDVRRQLLSATRERVRALSQEAGADVEICIEADAVSKVVREAALQHHADLVVIGRGHLRESFGGLRSNEYSIIRDSPCPVISL